MSGEALREMQAQVQRELELSKRELACHVEDTRRNLENMVRTVEEGKVEEQSLQSSPAMIWDRDMCPHRLPGRRAW